ncbi:MAG TPA: hypothetical protein VG389_16820 [Myxococcota bacterium]|jgi:hypothetical protein|nr:hypothetical protein [Myxococcota bacterium]
MIGVTLVAAAAALACGRTAAKGRSMAVEVLARVPWGAAPAALPLVLEDWPPYGEVSPDQVRRVPAYVRLRADAAGGAHLAGRGVIAHVGPGGALRGLTPLPADVSARLVDFACEPDGDCYLLQRDEGAGGVARLHRVTAAGGGAWSRTISEAASRVLRSRDGRVYVVAGARLIEVDPASGADVRDLRPDRLGPDAFVDGAGGLHSVVYDEATGRRGLAVFAPPATAARVTLGDDALYPWLATPIGVDAAGRLYVWNDQRVGRVADGGVEELAAFDALVPHGGGVYRGRALEVVRPDGTELTLGPPDRPADNARLIDVTADGRFCVLAGEAPGRRGALVMFAPDGGFIEHRPLAPDAAEARLPAYSYWDVDPDGRVLVPVVDRAGVAIVRLTAR